MKPIKTDRQLLSHLAAFGKNDMNSNEVYKACTSAANNGLQLPEEKALSTTAKTLLEVRRLMKNLNLGPAQELLKRLKNKDGLFRGDQIFLTANIYHLRGDQPVTAKLMGQAAKIYIAAGENYRALRAVSNSLICVSDLEKCNVGALQSLEQEAQRHSFHDIVAHIQRTRAIELLRQGRFAESISQSIRAVTSYEHDGCPEDKAVAVSLAAIGHIMTGELDKALEMRRQILVTDGKVGAYVKAFDQLICGKLPSLPFGHPLAEIDWTKTTIKSGTVLGKIIARLKLGYATRDELIASVWGAQALDPSYQHRLHSALNTLKKISSYQVCYDGTAYRLV